MTAHQTVLLSTADGDTTAFTADKLARDERGRWRLARDASGFVRGGELLTRPQNLGASNRRVALDWIEQWTVPLRFDKHPANPIYGPSKSGAWDTWTNGVSIIPTDNGRKYRMYYCGRKGAGIGFAEASVDDPLTWTEHPASPVLIPRSDNWEGDMLNQPRVVKVTETHWRMYYTGWGFPGPNLPPAPGTPWAMGVADSFDGGTTWKRVQDEPFMDRGDINSPDGGGACVPMVVRVGDQWMMWYTAAQVSPQGNQNIHLCLATSRDGLRWDKHPGNPVLTDDFSDNAKRSVTSRCYVRHDDGVFRMWYSFAKPNYKIFYAESLDGIAWERAPIGPVLNNGPIPAWDDVMVEYPEVQIVDGLFRLWFCGNGFGSVGYATGKPETGVAVSLRTGDTPTPDTSWNAWTNVTRRAPSTAKRYVQLRAKLWSTNPALSPALNSASLHAE